MATVSLRTFHRSMMQLKRLANIVRRVVQFSFFQGSPTALPWKLSYSPAWHLTLSPRDIRSSTRDNNRTKAGRRIRKPPPWFSMTKKVIVLISHNPYLFSVGTFLSAVHFDRLLIQSTLVPRNVISSRIILGTVGDADTTESYRKKISVVALRETLYLYII